MFCFSPVPAPSASGDQERAELAAGRRHLEARQALYAELQTQLDNCPESVREQLQEQLRRVSFTKPPSPPPRAARPEERSGGPGAPGPCSTCRTPGSVLWLGGDREGWGDWGWRFSFLLLQAALPGKAAGPSGGKGAGWGQGPSSVSPGPAPRALASVAWPSRRRVGS